MTAANARVSPKATKHTRTQVTRLREKCKSCVEMAQKMCVARNSVAFFLRKYNLPGFPERSSKYNRAELLKLREECATQGEMAKQLGLCVPSVAQLVQRFQLPRWKRGRQPKYSRDDVVQMRERYADTKEWAEALGCSRSYPQYLLKRHKLKSYEHAYIRESRKHRMQAMEAFNKYGTLQEAGKALGVTRERIRQLLKTEPAMRFVVVYSNNYPLKRALMVGSERIRKGNK